MIEVIFYSLILCMLCFTFYNLGRITEINHQTKRLNEESEKLLIKIRQKNALRD